MTFIPGPAEVTFPTAICMGPQAAASHLGQRRVTGCGRWTADGLFLTVKKRERTMRTVYTKRRKWATS